MKPVTLLSNEISKHITPVIRDYLINVYEHPEEYLDPESKESNSNQLIKFQMALKKIPNWTNTQIKKQIDEIKVRCTWFKKLLTALFVSYINMLSQGLKTNSTRNKSLDVKLPSDEFFVHTCFVTCAHDIYEDPYVMKKSERERTEELDKRIQKCVCDSIHKLIPMQDIINTFIPSADASDDVCFGGEIPSSGTESESAATAAVAAAGAAGAAEAATETTDDLKNDDLEEGEPKTIKVDQLQSSSSKEPGGEDEDLFPDAPDKISSKE